MSEPIGPRSGDTPAQPAGRNGVIEATTRAAIDLFSHNNPSQVSVREIAAKAGVSHALVHRYMGSKDDIFRAALKRAREDAADFWEGDHAKSGVFSLDLPAGRYLHMVIRGTLDGIPISAEDLRMPHVDRMLERLTSEPLPTGDPNKGFDVRLLFSAALALIASMDTAELFFLSQSGLEDADRGHIHSELLRLVWRICAMADPSATIE
jgi:AcrR family transcriptional regulator